MTNDTSTRATGAERARAPTIPAPHAAPTLLDPIPADEPAAASGPAAAAPAARPASAPAGEWPTTEGPLVPGRTFAGRYHVRRLIGVGGMGAVYHAWDTELAEDVAIKLIRNEILADPRLSIGIEHRLKRELLLARRVAHANVVRIHDLGTAEGVKYITMSFVDGVDLATLIAREGAMPAARAMRIGRRIAEALVAVHAAGIVHRDLKPANVMVGDDDRVWLTDFGVARLLGDPGPTDPGLGGVTSPAQRFDGLTHLGARVGTPGYMAPEQARGERVDGRVDLYALGLILHDLLTGGRRAEHSTPEQELEARLRGHVPDVAALVPDVPPALAALVARAVDADRVGRVQSAAEFAAELAAVESGATATAKSHAGASVSVPRAGSRRRTVVMAGVAAAALAAGAIAWNVRDARTTAPRRAGDAAATAATTAPRGVPVATVATVVALPLAARADSQDLGYLAAGLADELRERLARVPALRVPGRRSSLALAGDGASLADLGRTLGGDHVVRGELFRDGANVAVAVELVRLADGARVWSESFRRSGDAAIEVADDAVRGIARALRAPVPERLGPAPPRDPRVYELRFRSRALFEQGTEAAEQQGLEVVRRIVELAPDWAPGWVELSRAEQTLADRTNDAVHFTRARTAAQRAVEVGPDDAAAYAQRSLLRAGDLDFDGARADVERALQLDPADLLVQHRAANLYAAVGRLEDAVAAQWRATELDPLNGWRWMALTYYQLAAGRHAEARASADRALALEPDDFYVQYLGGLVDVLRGQPESALAAFAKMEGGQWSRQGRVLAEHLRGATESARATLTAMHAEYEANSANAFLIAEAHAWLGEHDAAFRWLDRAYVAREPGIAQYIRSSPLLAGLRDDARYAAYLRKVGMLR